MPVGRGLPEMFSSSLKQNGLLAVPPPLEQIGMGLDAIGRALAARPSRFPRGGSTGPGAAPPDRLAGLDGAALVLRVPDHHAGMVPSLPHPLGVFGNDLLGVRDFRAPCPAARWGTRPGSESPLRRRCRTRSPAENRCSSGSSSSACVLNCLVQPADPVGPPRQVAALGVLEEAVDAVTLVPRMIVRLAVEHRPLRLRVETEATACRSGPSRRRCPCRPSTRTGTGPRATRAGSRRSGSSRRPSFARPAATCVCGSPGRTDRLAACRLAHLHVGSEIARLLAGLDFGHHPHGLARHVGHGLHVDDVAARR